MQHLQQQKGEGLVHRNLPLYTVPSSEHRTDEEVFGKDLQQSEYFLYMSGFKNKEIGKVYMRRMGGITYNITA